ncbi:hypothetical protein [Sediminibacterium sp. KACHI17]|uniref:hypothetical protein n=1 Tax=Sediminibacterium sp. KACHI17 TaxID=1751071 RepID=UPI0033654EC4
MRLIYLANIIVAGWIGISSLFFPSYAAKTIFSGAYPLTPSIQLTGALWLSIAVLSIFGLFYPLSFSAVLFLQLIYKSCWLLFVCLPAIQNNKPYPGGMAVFFIIWVLVLPFVIPWKYLLSNPY